MSAPTNQISSSSVSGTLAAAVLSLNPGDREARVVLSGTYTGATGTIDVSMDNSTWINKFAVQEDTLASLSGTISPGAANLAFSVKVAGWGYVRFNPTAVSTGTLVATVYAGNSLGGDSNQNAIANVGLLSSSPSTGIGYAAGAGGAVTQITSRTTGVTLSKASGAITLVSAPGSATPFTMTVTNTIVAATDTVVVSQKSGTDAYSAVVSAVAAGSFKVTITDLTGTTTEQPVFNFAVIKSVAS